MGALTNVQMLVPAARFGPHAPLRVPGTKSRRADGLAAHRSPLDGLTAHFFPVTRRVAGDESFDAMARRFIAIERSRPAPRFPNWEAFPSFLRSQGKAASIEYVADIAELEMARGKAKCAANAPPIGAHAFPSLRAQRLRGLRLVLHPSIFLVASRFPIVTIWETYQREHENGRVGRWNAECALGHGRSSRSKSAAFRPAVMPSSAHSRKDARSPRLSTPRPPPIPSSIWPSTARS